MEDDKPLFMSLTVQHFRYLIKIMDEKMPITVCHHCQPDKVCSYCFARFEQNEKEKFKVRYF